MQRLRLRMKSYNKEYVTDMKNRRFVYLCLWFFLFLFSDIFLNDFLQWLNIWDKEFWQIYHFAIWPLIQIIICSISIFIPIKFVSKFSLLESAKYTAIHTILYALQIFHAIHIVGEHEDSLLAIYIFIFIPLLFTFSMSDILYRYMKRAKIAVNRLITTGLISLLLFMSYLFYYDAIGVDYEALEEYSWEIFCDFEDPQNIKGDFMYFQTKNPNRPYFVDKSDMSIFSKKHKIGTLIKANDYTLYFRHISGKLVICRGI